MSKLDTTVAVIVPVYNEESVINSVVQDIAKYYKYIICVNDGSKDNSSQIIAQTKAILIEHPINMGQGAALQTGIEFARQFNKIHYFATFDSDGQHKTSDLNKMVKEAKKNQYDIILGSRFLGTTIGLTKSKKAILKLAIWFTNVTSGLKLTDTHNGLRVFNRKMADEIQITMSDMSHASEILEIISKNKYTYKEVPVTIEYTDYSKRKGQSLINAINIGFDTLLRKVFK